MSEEEKRTLDFTKKYLEDNTGKYKFTNEDLIVLVNLIDKQQKEIEEKNNFIFNLKERLNNIQFEVEMTWRKIEKMEK